MPDSLTMQQAKEEYRRKYGKDMPENEEQETQEQTQEGYLSRLKRVVGVVQAEAGEPPARRWYQNPGIWGPSQELNEVMRMEQHIAATPELGSQPQRMSRIPGYIQRLRQLKGVTR